ncbi:proton-conducting transporter membrane subunit [Candidatus Tisiphia endosymbiont of Ditula angustiorana]|uniref:proton-conducting transporter transmembrane domain-containing protein n=1 Tax=Candidatus Tisiphia endosymbiont of Ditula angustiorana TaxID=3066272 RepID=UPI00312C81DE
MRKAFYKTFYIISIIYPIVAGILLINNKDEMVINLYNNSFVINFSSENKLIALAFIVVTLATNLYAISKNRKFEVLIGSLYSASSLVCLFAGDFVSMFASLEMMMIFAALLIFYGNYKNSVRAARQYLLTHLISGSLILIGISYIITHTSSSQIVSLTSLTENQDAGFIFYALILCGCLINVASIPFSGWIVNCYPFASSSGMVYLTSFTSKISIIILLKLFSGLEILKFFGLLMIIYGGVYACLEDNIKRLVGYLTISQLGFMLIAIGTKSQQANLGIIVFLFVHILYKALFGLYVAILIDKENIENCSEIKGIYSPKSHLLFVSLIVSVLFIIALPPFASFVTKIVVTNALDQDINYYAIFLLKIVTCIALFSTVKYKYDGTMSFLCRQESKEINRKDVLDILDPCLRRDDIRESRGDITHNRDDTGSSINLLHRIEVRLNILTRVSLFVMLSFLLVTSFCLEEGLKLVWSSYPVEIIDTNWLDLVKQMVIIVIGIIFALVLSKTISRCSTANINLDLFQFVENNIRRIYFKYNLVVQDFYDKIGADYPIFDRIEKSTLRKMKSWHNQSTGLLVVMILLIIFTILLI